jgi:hypothetical protein
VSGNKPPTRYDSAFTARVASHPRVAYYPLPGRGCATAVAFVIDEVLVGEAAASDPVVTARLQALGAFDTGRTVFGGLPAPPREDVHLWRVTRTGSGGTLPDVAALVWTIRPLLAARQLGPAQIAPNHVLIPSNNWHSCPWGPPEEETAAGTLPPQSFPEVAVVVIDSGYLAQSPIDPRVHHPVEYGEWFTGTPNGAGQFGPPYVWKPATPEQADANLDNALDSLAGHAGFVAGVIAQACAHARITVVDHNGAFVSSDVADTPIPTEASVVRSLWRHRSARVINVGFAFASLPNAQVVANTGDMSGPPSWTFQLALQGIDAHRTVIVCPAGNQSCPIPQYPAAFHALAGHQNVVGVASLSSAGTRSSFSNFGPWVACSTHGELVRSTFFAGWSGKKTEDAEPPGYPNAGTQPLKDFSSGWARWSGTSFAAPKVAAAIADGVGPATTPLAAWAALEAQYPASVGLGRRMPDLPPA